VTITQLFSILRARWRISLAVFVSVLVLAIGVTLMLPKQYKAVASVVVDAKPDPVSAMMYQGMLSPAFMATQVDVIKSDRVGLKVVRNLKLAENPQIREQWLSATQGEGSIETWLNDLFQASMDVKPSRESSVIEVTYKGADPKFAAALANAFVQAYIETTLELRVDPAKQYSSFFDERTKVARDTLEKAQSKLSEFQKENGIVATDERLDVENSRYNELSSQLVALQAVSAESGSRQTQANGASADRIQEVLNNPLISSLKSDLSRNEVRLQELNSRLGENHPSVLEVKANIAELKVKIDAETKRVTGGVGVSNTINRQREAEVRLALEAQRNKLLKLKATRDEGTVLLRDVESAQKAYESIQQRFNQTSLESQTTLSNVSVLTPAVAPLHYSSPKLGFNSLVAVFMGTLLAVIAGIAIEMFDRRVRTVADLSENIGLPILGVMLKPHDAKQSQRPQALLMQQKILGTSTHNSSSAA
jgi:succinoglycan biosynthesis transport protein ExoP